MEVCRLGKVVLVKDFLTAVRYHSASQSAGPGIAAQWHQTFEEWLQRNPDYLDRDRLNVLRQHMLERLVHQTFKAYYKHHLGQFGLLRSIRHAMPGIPRCNRSWTAGFLPTWLEMRSIEVSGKVRGLLQQSWTSGGLDRKAA